MFTADSLCQCENLYNDIILEPFPNSTYREVFKPCILWTPCQKHHHLGWECSCGPSINNKICDSRMCSSPRITKPLYFSNVVFEMKFIFLGCTSMPRKPPLPPLSPTLPSPPQRVDCMDNVSEGPPRLDPEKHDLIFNKVGCILSIGLFFYSCPPPPPVSGRAGILYPRLVDPKDEVMGS